MTFNSRHIRNRDITTHSNRRNEPVLLFEHFFNNLYNPLSSYNAGQREALIPNLDVSESGKAYHLEVELPGINQDDIDIKVDNNTLIIKGKKELVSESEEKNYHVRERVHGSFQRSIALPGNIDSDKIEAKFINGVLNILIPKQQHESSKKIEIKTV